MLQKRSESPFRAFFICGIIGPDDKFPKWKLVKPVKGLIKLLAMRKLWIIEKYETDTSFRLRNLIKLKGEM